MCPICKSSTVEFVDGSFDVDGSISFEGDMGIDKEGRVWATIWAKCYVCGATWYLPAMQYREVIEDAFDSLRDDITNTVVCRTCDIHFYDSVRTDLCEEDGEYTFYCPDCHGEL